MPATLTPDAPVTGRRKAAGRRWSATSTVQWLGADGATLARTASAAGAPPGAVKARVHYRLDGASRKPTLAGHDLGERVAALQGLLAAAYAHDWDAGPGGQPMPPVPLPPAGPAPAPARPGDRRHLAVVVALQPGRDLRPVLAGTLPQAGPVDDASDLPRLARWYREHCEATFKRRGGKRSPNTTGNYRSSLAFLGEHGRYQPGDPRLEVLGLEPGAPLRCDDPATGLNETDLVRLLETRATTNLRTRAANERALARWAGACASEERRAAREHRPARLPPAPQLNPEVAVERTIEAFAGVVRAMLHAAHRRGKIPYLPWTPTVDDEVTRAPAVHYTTRTVLSREQVGTAAAAMRA